MGSKPTWVEMGRQTARMKHLTRTQPGGMRIVVVPVKNICTRIPPHSSNSSSSKSSSFSLQQILIIVAVRRLALDANPNPIIIKYDISFLEAKSVLRIWLWANQISPWHKILYYYNKLIARMIFLLVEPTLSKLPSVFGQSTVFIHKKTKAIKRSFPRNRKGYFFHAGGILSLPSYQFGLSLE